MKSLDDNVLVDLKSKVGNHCYRLREHSLGDRVKVNSSFDILLTLNVESKNNQFQM